MKNSNKKVVIVTASSGMRSNVGEALAQLDVVMSEEHSKGKVIEFKMDRYQNLDPMIIIKEPDCSWNNKFMRNKQRKGRNR